MEATEKSAAEFDRKLAESEAKFDREMAERAAEDARRKAEFDKQSAEINERDKKIREEIFGIGQNAGHHAEQYFQKALSKSSE